MKANNGMRITRRVIRVGKRGTKNCWRATACVDGNGMAMSHHDTRRNADLWAKSMQLTYMEVHSGKEEQ